jgi:hypothetical protein
MTTPRSAAGRLIVMTEDFHSTIKTGPGSSSPAARSAVAQLLLDELDRAAGASWLELCAKIQRALTPVPQWPGAGAGVSSIVIKAQSRYPNIM